MASVRDAIVRITESMGQVVESYLEKGKQIKKIYSSIPEEEEPKFDYRCEKCNRYQNYPVPRTDITYSEDPSRVLNVKFCYRCLHRYMCLIH